MSLRVSSVLVVMVLVTGSAACSRDPETAKQRHLEAGNAYAREAKYREAILEYRNAINYDAAFAEARLRLAETYERTADVSNAYREYTRAADLLPERAEVQVKAGNFLLVAGRFEDAKARAEQALEREPANVGAQVLLGYSLAGMKDLDHAIEQLERALVAAPGAGLAFSNLGTLQMARGDAAGAEAAFRKAVEINPDSRVAWIALANFLWTQARHKESETALLKARELEPGNLVAARALAILYMSTRRAPEAEPILKAAAEQSPTPFAGLMLADYYTATSRLDDALATLTRLSSHEDAEVDVRGRMATILHTQGRVTDAYAIIDDLIEKHADIAGVRLLKAQFLLRDRRFDQSLAESRRAIEFDARSAVAYRLLGEAHAARYELAEATQALTRSLEIEPRAVEVRVRLARIELARGRTDAALDYAQQVLGSNPNHLDARLLVATALMQRNDVRGATAAIAPLVGQRDSADAQVAVGNLALLKGDHRAAREAFARALALAPQSRDALGGAVNTAIAARDVAGARKQVDARLASAPNDTHALMLSARTSLAAGDTAQAEGVLREIIEIDAEHLPAYDLLGRIYVAQRRLPEAQAEFERLVERRPLSTGARTMVATLLHLQNRIDAARQQYEAIVQTSTDAAVASNNLAWLYATAGGNLDVALTLAQAAKKELPDQPEVNDTLGWVYYRKGLFGLAVEALEQSVQKDPDDAVYLYHLGMAYAGQGDRTRARSALDRALALNPGFDGAEQARRVSVELSQAGARSGTR
ncbi:MAG TPA: tetratricopeptide repeat protein [Vicinamibacterales bacterium]